MNILPSEYFSRMAAVPEIGPAGLEKLRSARVTVVGAGGVGSSASFYLAEMGVGHLRLIDQDIVETTNLHRLHFPTEYLYHPKAEAAAETLPKYNPWVEVEPIVDTLRADNVEELLSASDIVVDGLDNFRTRYLVNLYACESGIPYIFTSAIGNQGHVGLFHSPKTGCLECALPGVVDRPEESCESLGVTPAIVGLIGALAAAESAKCLTGVPTGLRGRILTVDGSTSEFVTSVAPRRNDCPTCGSGTRAIHPRPNGTVTVMCDEKTVNVMPESRLPMNLRSISQSVPEEQRLLSSDTVLVFRRGPMVVSLFRSGRVLIVGAREEEALEIARDIWVKAGTQLASVA
jgi:molybdopterin-synthase adenylyltransferase